MRCYFRACVKEVLRNMTFGNYNNLAQNGSSTSYIELLQGKHFFCDVDIFNLFLSYITRLSKL